MAEEISPRRHGSGGLEIPRARPWSWKFQGIAGLLVPEQRNLRAELLHSDRGLQIETAVGVAGELRSLPNFLKTARCARDLQISVAPRSQLHDIVPADRDYEHFPDTAVEIPCPGDNSNRPADRRTPRIRAAPVPIGPRASETAVFAAIGHKNPTARSMVPTANRALAMAAGCSCDISVETGPNGSGPTTE